MARLLEPPDIQAPAHVRKILGGRGRKLHTHEMHIRRTANKGYIARHELRDSKGQPPADGQRGEMEYALPDHEALLAHVGRHMAPPEPAEPGDEGPEEAGPEDAGQANGATIGG